MLDFVVISVLYHLHKTEEAFLLWQLIVDKRRFLLPHLHCTTGSQLFLLWHGY